MTQHTETYIIDRHEEGVWSVLEAESGGRTVTLPRAWLPSNAPEGSVVRVHVEEAGRVHFEISEESTQDRRERLRHLRDSIPRGPSGDFSV